MSWGQTERSQLVKIGTKQMSKETKIERMARLLNQMAELGFSYSETKALLRIERTLQRWAEGECGDSNNYASRCIERDEETGKPFLVILPHTSNQRIKQPIPDREKAAQSRLAKIMAAHPSLWAYSQGDCRGSMLHVGKKDGTTEKNLENLYTRGIAVCA